MTWRAGGGSTDADASAGEIGGCHDFLPGRLRGGLDAGKSLVRQDLAFSGESRMDGEYLLAELDHRLSGSGLVLSVTGIHGRWDARIERGYLNAGAPDRSRGDTEVTVSALRARVDWPAAWQIAATSVSTQAAFTATRTRIDGYTESGGGFPARFERQRHTARELRVGLSAERRVSEATRVRGRFKGVHRFDSAWSGAAGQVVGLFAFSLPGAEVNSNGLRAGLDVDHRFGPHSVLSASLTVGSSGEDPDLSGAVRYRLSF